MKYILSLIIILLQSCSPEDQWGKTNLEVNLGDQKQTVTSGEGYFWSNPIYNSDNTICYVT